jgi:hypothetical protein
MIPQELLYMRRPVSFQARFGRTLGRLSAKNEYLFKYARARTYATHDPGLRAILDS